MCRLCGHTIKNLGKFSNTSRAVFQTALTSMESSLQLPRLVERIRQKTKSMLNSSIFHLDPAVVSHGIRNANCNKGRCHIGTEQKISGSTASLCIS